MERVPAALCLLTAAGALAAVLGPEITLSWRHSIEKVEWQEDWRVEHGRPVLAAARVKGSGAGMEPAPGAVLKDGWWEWRPALAQERVVLGRSGFVEDYRVCRDGICRPMAELAPADPQAPTTILAACE